MEHPSRPTEQNEESDITMTDPKLSQGSDALDMSRSEVRSRSLAGVLYMTSSGFANLVVGFLSNLVIARLLTPTDFGVVAVGSTVALVGGVVVDGGLGSGMVRRARAPTMAELRTFNGIQLAIALAVWLPVVFAAPSFGLTGAVTAIMVAALPISVLGGPGRVVLTREMRYDRQAAIDVLASISSQVFSVATVALGAGVWGLAAGSLVRASVMTLLTGLLTSVGFVRPSLRGWGQFGELMRFGLKFQATWVALVARELGLNAVIALVAGVATLGFWTLANRLIQLPILAFTSLYAVGFPAMSNLLARGEDPGPIILRAVRRASIAGTLVFPAFAASSPALVPALFGSQWQESADPIPLISLSTLVLGSISVGASSYLNASGRPGIVAVAMATFGVIWVSVTAPLLTFVGVAAVGIGNLAGALVEAFILDRATRRTAGVAPYRPLLRPLAVALIAGVAGWTLCVNAPSGLLIGVAAAAVTFALSIFGLRLACSADLNDLVSLAVQTVRAALPRHGKATVDET
jgi:O-antigen/teichoic acid export membrane protein